VTTDEVPEADASSPATLGSQAGQL
jgi:hypothetical protein